MSEVLSQEWRGKHCAKGDEALAMAEACARGEAPSRPLSGHEGASFRSLPHRQMEVEAPAWAAIAQAHYAAANVRARPAAPKVTMVPEGVHVRVDGWCSRCGGMGELETPHVDISS